MITMFGCFDGFSLVGFTWKTSGGRREALRARAGGIVLVLVAASTGALLQARPINAIVPPRTRRRSTCINSLCLWKRP